MLQIVTNTKGGVGKSTISANFLTGFIRQKTGVERVKYVEIDDQNENIKTLSQSKIIDSRIIKTEDVPLFAKQAFLSDEDIVVDVGGNMTATLMLDRINALGGMRGGAVYYIPMLDSLQDQKNASDTYKLIRSIDKESKIIFCLNKCFSKTNEELTREQFIFFFGKVELEAKPFFSDIAAVDENVYHIRFNANTLYNISAYMEQTIPEVAEVQIQERINEAIRAQRNNPGKKAEALRLLYMEELINTARNLLENEYKPLYAQLTSILEDKNA